MEEVCLESEDNIQTDLQEDISDWSEGKRAKVSNLLEKMIQTALEMLYQHDMHLIDNRPITNEKISKNDKHHVGERAIVFRFAHYLQNLLDEDEMLRSYDLDCEYNRNGIMVKSLPSFSNGTYPDVILHRRGSNKCNLLVMEFKTYWNEDQSDDISKIEEFTNQKGEYKFLLGETILIETKLSNVKQRLFAAGKEIIKKGNQ